MFIENKRKETDREIEREGSRTETVRYYTSRALMISFYWCFSHFCEKTVNIAILYFGRFSIHEIWLTKKRLQYKYISKTRSFR